MDTTGKQTAELPADYLDVMLPELLATGRLKSDAHTQVLNVLGKKGFKPAISTLSVLLTLEMLKNNFGQ